MLNQMDRVLTEGGYLQKGELVVFVAGQPVGLQLLENRVDAVSHNATCIPANNLGKRTCIEADNGQPTS